MTMASRQNDPTPAVAGAGGSPGSPLSGQDGSLSQASSAEQELAEERKRRSGADRAFQREREKLNQEIAQLRSRLESQQRAAPTLPDLNPNDPAAAHILDIKQNLREWQEFEIRERESRAHQAEIDAAVAEARRQGVPEDVLDDRDPSAVRRSAAEYLKQKEIGDLKAEVAQLRSEIETAVSRTRQELGATAVSTATGAAPTHAGVDEQIAEVDRYMASLSGGGPAAAVELLRAQRAKAILVEHKHVHPDGRPYVPPRQ